MKDFFAELKRRNVYKVAVAYGVVAWLLIQVTDTVLPRLNLPDWAVTLVIVLMLLGFPVALVLAWAFELTPEGVVRAEDAAPEKSITRLTGRKLTVAIVLVGTAAAAMFAFQFVRPKTSSPAVQEERAAISEKSIAVLPFENASGNPETEYLSDGIAEALINSLTELQQLKVIARATAFRYRGREIDPQTVGRELKVRAVLMGRVRHVGDSLNVQVDLVDAVSGAQLWGKEYERKVADVLSVKQAIAREVTENLQLRLSGEQQQKLTKRDTTNPEAYQAYLRGRYYWNKRTEENLRKAIEEFQQAIEKDPNYALAYTGLADSTLLSRPDAEQPESEIFRKATAYAERALEIDDSLAEAHTSLAGIGLFSWQWDQAEKGFKRSIELNPNYPTTHHWRGIYFMDAGRHDEAVASLQRAQALDPLSRVIGYALAQAYLLKEDAVACLQEANKIIELDPNYYGGYSVRGHAYLKQGRYPEALADIQKAAELSEGDSQMLGWLGYAYAVTGRRSEALGVMHDLKEKFGRRESGGTEIAAVYLGLGEKDQAFGWFEKDVQANQRRPLIELKRAWVFQSLHGDPRYIDLARRIGLQP